MPDPPATTGEQDPSPARTPSDERVPRRQRSTIPSFLFISLVLYMLTNNQNEDAALHSQYLDAWGELNYKLSNYSAWLNGTTSNYTLPEQDHVLLPLAGSLMTFGSKLDPKTSSYYTNLTGHWRGGDLTYYNLTDLPPSHETPAWYPLARDFVAGANMTNATEVAERLGSWNWTRTDKLAIWLEDKMLWSENGPTANVSKEIAMVHGRIDLTDTQGDDEFRLEFSGVHFIGNGSIYALAEPKSQGVDIRSIPSIVPAVHMNESARVVEAEFRSQVARLKNKIDAGTIESNSSGDDEPKSGCSFYVFAQIHPSNIPLELLKELEDEIDNPTGIPTIKQPKMEINGIIVSKNCGILYKVPSVIGLKTEGLSRKITTYSGISALINLTLLALLSRQISRSRSAAGLSRVSKYPFLIQSLIDAVSFIGHVTLAILADGRPSIAALANAGLACVLFVYQAQFTVLISQIQAPEDVRTRPTPLPPVTASTPPVTAPAITSINERSATETTVAESQSTENSPASTPAPTPVPVTVVTPPTAPQPSLFRFFIEHFRNDPSARLWAIMSFFLLVVFRLVIALSLPLLFCASLYGLMWTAQIYRAARRGRTSGLSPEYLIGATVGRLYFLLYYLACPNNILDVEPRKWVYIVVAITFFQVFVILLQEYLGPAFFLPSRYSNVHVYDYHPPMPLPDPEAPEQSLGDCSICMEAIVVDAALRHSKVDGEKSERHPLTRRTSTIWAQGARKNYSLAPCHHLFHTACLERWLAIKNICPQCRRPLPPL